MEEGNSVSPVCLIVGVTGMVGFSLAEALKNHPSTSLWKVYGISRRSLPGWFPSSLLHNFISLDALDRSDTIQKLHPIAHEVTHVFWVALQIRESEETNISLNSTMLKNVLDALLTSNPSRLLHVTIQTGTKHYMGPIFDPSLEGQLTHQEPPFQEDLPRLPYPNFYYALEDLVASYLVNSKATYSIHRSSIIIGASTRSFYNTLLTLSVYATICKYKGLAFRYPGSKYTWEHFCDMADARVLAEQHIWAAASGKAKNQAFNCANGDVFTWKGLWKVLCDVFDLEFVGLIMDESKSANFDWVEMMKDKGQVWDEIVERHGLLRTKLEEITCFEALATVMNFRFQHVCSMNKSKEFGFSGYADTFKGIRMWIGRIRDMKFIP